MSKLLEERMTSGPFPLRVLLSQKEGVGGAGGLRPGLGGHAHQWLGQWHGGGDPSAHAYASHSWHSTAHGGHPCQGDHGNGLSGHGGQGHRLCNAAEARGHRADAHLVEGRRNRLGHLEWICDGSWSWSGAAWSSQERVNHWCRLSWFGHQRVQIDQRCIWSKEGLRGPSSWV